MISNKKNKPFVQTLSKKKRNELRKEWNKMADFLEMPKAKTKRKD